VTKDHLGQARRSDQDRPQDGLDRLTVAEAAERLGVTQDAVRKRMARGTIRHVREDGRLYVYLDTFERASKTVQDEGQADASKTVQDVGQDRYIAALEDQVQFLRRELERKDAILLRLAERIPELEAPPEPRDEPETARQDAGGVEERGERAEPQEVAQKRSPIGERPNEETVRRPWWIRVFGG
jgi:excisionase family DNA binding protein